jgi:hypothetical protein
MKISPAIRLPSPIVETIEPEGASAGNKATSSIEMLHHFSVLGTDATSRGVPVEQPADKNQSARIDRSECPLCAAVSMGRRNTGGESLF